MLATRQMRSRRCYIAPLGVRQRPETIRIVSRKLTRNGDSSRSSSRLVGGRFIDFKSSRPTMSSPWQRGPCWSRYCERVSFLCCFSKFESFLFLKKQPIRIRDDVIFVSKVYTGKRKWLQTIVSEGKLGALWKVIVDGKPFEEKWIEKWEDAQV